MISNVKVCKLKNGGLISETGVQRIRMPRYVQRLYWNISTGTICMLFTIVPSSVAYSHLEYYTWSESYSGIKAIFVEISNCKFLFLKKIHLKYISNTFEKA